MALSSISCFTFATIVMVGILTSCQQISAQGCEGDFQGLVKECARFVSKIGGKADPSQPCCDIVKKVDVPCVCNHISKDVENIISMQKVVFVAQFCGKPLAHGSKCGSYTVPPSS
ncbi:hypothetical protein IFM89_037604 [Coptis chinensis]|uniref:Bifunctional inhibitor/plant lipid transfer protein/seed storage helical domain-containing protein n=1 Tax=Coptis chinensis TaxID=261450 RepID=A0A835H7P8_9MAGN|nr:hypothetical protein IFM89_037604 [Coptis chinensis]